jgi:hypothetical protein
VPQKPNTLHCHSYSRILPEKEAKGSQAFQDTSRLNRTRARWLVGDGATEREGHEESISGFTEARAAAWQPGDGSEEMAEEVLGAGGAWV